MMPIPMTTSLNATRWLAAIEAPAENPETECSGMGAVELEVSQPVTISATAAAIAGRWWRRDMVGR